MSPDASSLIQPAAPGFGPWQDPNRRRKAAVIGLAAVMVVLLADALWSILGMVTVGGVVSVPAGWFEEYDVATVRLGQVYLVSLVISAVLFVRWQRLAIRNTAFLGCEKPEPSPSLASLAWFLPIVSLFLPLVSMRRVALWSRPPGGPDRRSLLNLWWAVWLLSNFAFSITAVLQSMADEAAMWITVNGVDAGLTLVLFAAGLLAIKIVNTLSQDQTAKAESLGQPRSGLPF